jgi:PII-like signaling protein
MVLTAYFAERERVAGRFLAEALLDLFEHREVATSVMLRGIAGFGPTNVVRSDRSLSLSEDPPVTINAVDTADRLTAVADEVATMTGRGLITLERASLETLPGDPVRLSLYLGRKQTPGYLAVTAVLHRLGFAAAEVFLGVDGTVAGLRRRAGFVSRNADVPLLVSGVGTAAQAGAAIEELRAMLPDPLLVMERIQICKDGGRVLAGHHEPDPVGFRKLTVRTAEDARHHGQPVHRALIRRLKQSGLSSGATTLRGIWGYRDGQRPHGDRFLQLTRHVPVSTVMIDTADNIAAVYPIVDELTAESGLVTVEAVPAVLALHGERRRGSLRID